MIGDWVKSNSKLRQVLGVATTRIRLSTNNKYECLIAKSATPIPITEGWLKLNGFELAPLAEKVIYGKSISKDCTIFHMNYNNVSSLYVTLYKKDTADIKCQVSIVEAEYIHQLQQAYRLATGKELKIKF